MTISPSELIHELNALIRLTESEAAVAQARVAQARDDSIRLELESNADDAVRRRDLLIDAVRELGGAPDLVGAVIGRVGTLARTQTLDQAMTVQQALLADLSLEHQLRDRARFARVLADTLEERPVVQLLERLERSHDETIRWIETRLAEVAVGGPSAIRPTPVQVVAGIGQRAATLPSRAVVAGANRAVVAASGLQDIVSSRLARTRDLAVAAGSTVTAGRDGMLRATEEQAEEQGATRTAQAIHRVRAESGALDVDELPVSGYEGMSASQAKNRIGQLDDAEDVRAMLAYEAANRNRKSILTAAEQRIEELASEANGS